MPHVFQSAARPRASDPPSLPNELYVLCIMYIKGHFIMKLWNSLADDGWIDW